MPHCSASECSYQTKKVKEKRDETVSLHKLPSNPKLAAQWKAAINRVSYPAEIFLCSKHFEPSCFEADYELKIEIWLKTEKRGKKPKRKLKTDAVPTIFSHKVKDDPKPREASVRRSAKRKHEETLQEILTEREQVTAPGPSCEPDRPICTCLCHESVEKRDVGVQTLEVEYEKQIQNEAPAQKVTEMVISVPPELSTTVNSKYKCRETTPLTDHSYTLPELEELPQLVDADEFEDEDDEEVTTYLINDIPAQEMHSSPVKSPPSPAYSDYVPDNYESSSDGHTQKPPNSVPSSPVNNQRTFLVFEDNLKQLMKFCPECGGTVVNEELEEIANEGSQYSVILYCINGCKYKWQAQPSLVGAKGSGNVLITSSIYFSGIPFTKFKQFSELINLKSINTDTFYRLRENFVYPVVDTHWEEEQEKVFSELRSREEPVTLIGDGRCDSPGHSAKYCTYTMMDVKTEKIVDFQVVSVSQVKNSNAMEKKGFIEVLENITENGVKVGGVSTDAHPQIKKYMREDVQDVRHHIDPWHTCKNMYKKLKPVTKKKDCKVLEEWIPSIVNHFWWSVQTCEGDAEKLKERWVSITQHIVNRHEWQGNVHYHKCAHGELSEEARRKKKWLKPGSPAHNELVKIVTEPRLLKILEYLTGNVHTTALECYHALYLKYLPKMTHFSHKAMMEGTKLAALDHNHSVGREQAVILQGEKQGEPRFKMAWSKVTQRYDAEPVPVAKSYNYLHDMTADVLVLAHEGTKHQSGDTARHVMAPAERPPRQEIITKRLQLSRFQIAEA